MKTPNVAGKPAIRGKWIAGFLLEHCNRNKKYCNLISCIFLCVTTLLLASVVYAVEASGSYYAIDLIEFMQGGGFTSSPNIYAEYTAIGGTVLSIEESISDHYILFAGLIPAFLARRLLPEGVLIGDLTCRTDVLGNLIPPATWQKDNDPYFYWNIIVEPPSLVSGFSVSLDVVPDEVEDITAPHYQFPVKGIISGKHDFYVLPFTTGTGWDKNSLLKFEIWVDVDPPAINQIRPSSGEITGNALIPIGCQLSDADSGLDSNSTTLSVNGSNVQFKYDAGSKTLEYIPSTPLANGKNTVFLKAYDAVGNYIVKGWDFIVDALAPTGSIKINNGEEFTHSAYVFLNIQAEDAITGVKSVYLSNDGVFDTEISHPQAYNPIISNWLLEDPDRDELKNVYVKFQDYAGNISQAYKASINLKRLTPDTSIISGPPSITEETSAAFRFEASKAGCQFSHKLDNQDWTAWSSAKEASFSGLPEGNHYFYVKSAFDLNQDDEISIDEEDATPDSWVWTIQPKTGLEKLREKILFWRR